MSTTESELPLEFSSCSISTNSPTRRPQLRTNVAVTCWDPTRVTGTAAGTVPRPQQEGRQACKLTEWWPHRGPIQPDRMQAYIGVHRRRSAAAARVTAAPPGVMMPFRVCMMLFPSACSSPHAMLSLPAAHMHPSVLHPPLRAWPQGLVRTRAPYTDHASPTCMRVPAGCELLVRL